ncbi:MAG: hypothetical protein MET45_21045 [Nostoc sp. LLA-1]|nr:hypothetical protein [Cyanocohniella sp. LLY]
MTESDIDNFPTYEEIYEYFEKKNLVDAIGLPRIESCVNKLLNLPLPLKKDFLYWWQTGELKTTVDVKGTTVEFISKKKKWDVAFTFTEFSDLYLNPEDDVKFSLLTKNTTFVDGWLVTG